VRFEPGKEQEAALRNLMELVTDAYVGLVGRDPEFAEKLKSAMSEVAKEFGL
jgi:hypothetical protein